MSYNQNYYNFRLNFTFRQNYPPQNYLPFPPPPPPPYYNVPPVTQPPVHLHETDQELLTRFESKIKTENSKPKNTISISKMRDDIYQMVLNLDDIKNKKRYLADNLKILSEEEWQKRMIEIEQCKVNVNKMLAYINNMHFDTLRKFIAKRSAKRLRLKRLRLERKKEKEETIKKLEEKSRKIDENLQKIKDDIIKVKQEEEAKLQADMVLKEVLRKKSDAKKCLAKLDALVKLRKARQNTAKGRGATVSEKEAQDFINSINKLKFLWTQKLASYEKEEIELRDKLKQDTEQNELGNVRAEQTVENLFKWREYLFGGALPHVDFCGDVARFVTVRSQWDQFVSVEGSPLPVGWVLPVTKNP
ncbi:inner centromere protein isoform X2 [Galleria mellonella]|uniref:Inner centromere protein isoform X2 n=1 Tax=Galleria mellonella TaxID=7137 RepID=A0A6J1WS92_GALME|nr:inner centromere protein isoform X2 [Galleria mellonella]